MYFFGLCWSEESVGFKVRRVLVDVVLVSSSMLGVGCFDWDTFLVLMCDVML